MERFISKKQRDELLAELRIGRERKFADRIKVILLIDKGQKYLDIAKFLFLDEKTILNWRRTYEEDGLENLVNDYYQGRVCFLDSEHISTLNLELESRVYLITQAVRTYFKKTFGVCYTAGDVTSLLHRIGFSYKKPKASPSKANSKDQRKFLNRYRDAKANSPVYFADSTHPMLNPVLAPGWIKKGKDFQIKTNSGRQRVNINGAIEFTSLSEIARTCDTVNQKSMCELLRVIRKKNPGKKHLYLVLDNAPYNRVKSVRKLAKQLEIKNSLFASIFAKSEPY